MRNEGWKTGNKPERLRRNVTGVNTDGSGKLLKRGMNIKRKGTERRDSGK